MSPRSHNKQTPRPRLNPSWAALVVATLALFITLGGPAWASRLVSGAQIKNDSITSAKIKNGSITSAKIGKGQIENANLATNAVTGSNVAAGSLTAANVAPNTFLPANGVAANSAQLGGVPASGYLTTTGTAADSNKLGGVAASGFVQGSGNMLQNWVVVQPGSTDVFLMDVGLGEVDASCVAASPLQLPELTFTAEAQPVNFVEWGTTYQTTADVNVAPAMLIGASYTEPNSSGVPQAIDFQAAQSGVFNPSRVATVWTTDHYLSGTGCVFTAQALTTGV
jgi:hypothetical protein